MAVVALEIVGALTLKLYDIVETVSANRTQCGVIGDRVSRIMTEIDTLDPNKHESLFKKGVFANFQSTLESAVDLCSKFVDKSNFRQWFAYNSDNDKFDMIVNRLDQAIQDLQLSLAFDTSTWQQVWQKAQQMDTDTMINLFDGLAQGQQNIMEAVAEIKLRIQQGVLNVTQSPTDPHLWLNSKDIKFDCVKNEDEDLWHKAEPLGSGSFGTVYRGSFREEAVAIKSVNFNSTKAQESFIKEVNILFMLHHPNITTFHGAVLESKTGNMVLELFDRSLADALHIHGHVKLTADEKLAIINNITSAMQYLHTSNPKIVHSDLKPANVMINQKGVAKIIDFGLSSTKSSSRSSRNKVGTAGTTPYQPPELHETGVGDHTVDIYAFGITVNEIFTGEVPFADVPAKRIAHLVIEGTRPPIARTLPLYLRQIVEECLQTTPTSRPEFLEIHHRLYQPTNRTSPLIPPLYQPTNQTLSLIPPLYQNSNRNASLIPPHNSSDQPSSEKTPVCSPARYVDYNTAYHGIVSDSKRDGAATISICKKTLVKSEDKEEIYNPTKQRYADELACAATFVSDVAQRSIRLQQNLDKLMDEEIRRRLWGLGIATTVDKKKPETLEKEPAKGVSVKTTQIARKELDNDFDPTSQARRHGPPTSASHEDTTAKAQANPHPQPGQASLGLDIRWEWPRRVQITRTPSCIFASCTFEGGADGAIKNFSRVFKYAPEHYLYYGEWNLIFSCRTVEKQRAVAFMLATNATVTGWNGTLKCVLSRRVKTTVAVVVVVVVVVVIVGVVVVVVGVVVGVSSSSLTAVW